MRKILVSIVLFSVSIISTAQYNFVGLWEGKMNAGVELRMIFKFSADSLRNISATLDGPDQGLKDIKASSVQIKNDSIYISMDQFQAKYLGRMVNDSTIAGTFYQGVSLSLNLKRIKKLESRKRPQTPTPPFPYKVEELIYHNKDRSISYGATITIPEGKGPFPAVLLLTGSGQQNRDEEILEHKPFAVIADHLTRKGFLVLRVDDRGMGKTTGDVMAATTRDFTNDATVSFEYLKNRREVDKKKMGLIGHSEGGMIAQIMAAERDDIDFVIMLGAPGERILKLMHDQNEAVLVKMGMSKDFVAQYLPLYDEILITALSSKPDSQITNVTKIVDEWIAKTPPLVVMSTTGIRDSSTKKNFVNQFVGQLSLPWFRYFLNYDPSNYLGKISAKVLAINGSEDIQVNSKSNLAAIETALKNGKSKKYDIRELKGLNHLFQECQKCSTAEYGLLEQTFSPEALDIISTWLLHEVVR